MRIYPFFIPHAGCREKCLFCNQSSGSVPSSIPGPDEVFRALDALLPVKGDGEVAYYGGTFTFLPRDVQRGYLESVRPHVEKGRVSGVRISTRPDAIDEKTAAFLRQAGVTTVELGCQSFSPDILKRVGRDYPEDAVPNAVRHLRGEGFNVGLQLMPGLPGGDRNEALYSMKRAIELKPDFLRVYPAVVLKGTGLETLFLQGAYNPLALDDAVEYCAELLCHCRSSGIPVIRMGLQGTPELDGGVAWTAGPYHPAFGQMVKSRIWLRALSTAFAAVGEGGVCVNPSDHSDAIGHGRKNLDVLKECFANVAIHRDPCVPREHLLSGDRPVSIWDLAAYHEENLS